MNGPATSAIRVQVDGAIGRMTLARPERLNALDRATLEELALAAEWLDSQPDVKVVIVTGQGSTFSSGFDLTDETWSELGSLEQSAVVGRRMVEAVGGMRAVTLASLRGHCVGGGVVLASACDLRFAARSSRFRIPEVDLGVPLLWTGIPRIVRELGPSVTKELVMSGRQFDAHEGCVLRFINRVVADEELDGAVDAFAAELAAKPAFVHHTTKRQVDQAAPPVPDVDSGVGGDVALFATARADPECQATAAEYQRQFG